MVLTNLYGTIVSNLLCGLIGGPGLTAGANYGPRYALFEPGTRNTGTKLSGQNKANPVAMLQASVCMLKHIHLDHHAEVCIRKFVPSISKLWIILMDAMSFLGH